jgi:hypothetical protein
VKRTGFRRPERPERAPIILRPVERSGVYAPSTDLVVAIPKGPEAKPGKGAQTTEERRWIEAIVEHGCVACWLDGVQSVPPCVHHILRGGRRMGHLYSLPLCPGHHQDGTGPRPMVARHPHKARFEQRYGSEQTLLNGLQSRLGFPLLSLESK